jgi:hypothetical protein
VSLGSTHTPETLLTLSKTQVEASIRRWGELLCTTVYICKQNVSFVSGFKNNHILHWRLFSPGMWHYVIW